MAASPSTPVFSWSISRISIWRACRRGYRKPIEEAWKRHANPGRVLGTVELVDCVQTSASPWAIDGYWHWLLADPKPYTRPVAAKGQLGLWEWKR